MKPVLTNAKFIVLLLKVINKNTKHKKKVCKYHRLVQKKNMFVKKKSFDNDLANKSNITVCIQNLVEKSTIGNRIIEVTTNVKKL